MTEHLKLRLLSIKKFIGKRPRRGNPGATNNGEYDIDDELSLKERLKRAEAVSRKEQNDPNLNSLKYTL